MAQINDYPSGPVESGDYFIGATQKGKTKRITMSSVIALTKEAINTLDNFAIDNTDNGYTLGWSNNALTINGPSIEDAILSVSGSGPVKSVTTDRNTVLSLKYEGAGNIVDAAKKYKSSVNDVQFLVQDKLSATVSKLDISKLPYTNNEGTVTSIRIADDLGTASTITSEGAISIKGGNGITTKMVGSDLTVEYLGKVGGTVNKVTSLDETAILTSISQDGSEVYIRPAKVPFLKAGRYDFASVTVDQLGRVTKIEDQKNKIDALTARIEQLESQIQTQDESSTDTSD
jgi:BMFP domain-containing protein YqiC